MQKRVRESQIPNRGASAAWLEIVLVFEDKSHEQIQQQWRAEGNERRVDKVLTYGTGFYSEFASPPLANAKGLFFEEVKNAFHL